MGTTYWATFDDNGAPTAFYPSDVWTAEMRPPEAVEISKEDYLILLEPGATYVDGKAAPPAKTKD